MSTRTRTRPPRREPEQPRLLTARQTSERLGVSRTTFFAWLRTGRLGAMGIRSVELPGVFASHPMRRYDAASVDLAIKKLGRIAAPAPAADAEASE